MADLAHITTEEFQKEVLEAGQPVLVDFTAEWCGPCKMLDPIVGQLAVEWAGKVKVVALDVDENPDVDMGYQVMGGPTLLLFVNGQPSQRTTGYLPKDKIIARFGALI